MNLAFDDVGRREGQKRRDQRQRQRGDRDNPLEKEAQKTRDALDRLLKQAQEEAAPFLKPSAARSKQDGNENTEEDEERRKLPLGPQYRSASDSAAGAIAAARAHLEEQLATDKRIRSDPRFERDQKVFDMGQKGQLGMVPPSEAEKIALAAKSGVPAEALEKLPSTPEEQADEDMERLEQGEKRAETISATANSGDKEARALADKQNLDRMKDMNKKPPEPPKGSTIK